MDQYIGKLLDNRYEILELVGTGGMAKVYKARDHRLNRLVAIKILREELAQDAEFRRRFHDESQAVAMLSHPNIVAVYDVSRSSELEYIVMELIDGITLKQYMQKKGNKLNWREALHFITQITKALGHAHSRGIIHRDIKPHNIMVLRDGSVKVADFGIARVASGGHSTLTQEALGSVHYISPEQARGSHIDSRSDLYSTGVVLYEMITGRLPFEGDTPVSVAIQHINSIPLSPRELDPTIPEALEAITMKAMAPNPDNRYLSANEMLTDLEEFRKNPNINFDYSAAEFSPEDGLDDDRTQIRPAHVTSGRTSGERRYEEERSIHRSRRYEDDYSSHRRGRYEDDDDLDELPRRSPIWPIVLAAAAVLLFVGLMGYFLVNTIFADMLAKPVTYPVPNLVGKLYEDVKDNTELLGRFQLVEGETVTNDADPGTILEQSPEGESSVGETITEITVTISGGPEIIPMPNLDGMEYNAAYRLLQEKGLKPVAPPTYEDNDTVEKGYIISYTPFKDIPLSPGTEVHMVVSRGPKVEEIDMPNLVGKTKTEAENEINMYKLTPGRMEPQYDETVEEGKVISQYPLANAKVDEGTVVNLIISMGPDPDKQPPEPPAPQPSTKTVTVNLASFDGLVNVRVLMDGAQVFGQDVDANMEPAVEFDVTGTGQKELSVYINGVLDNTIPVDFDAP
ncbi:MAG: Stk1 family PASTA domain-containing Ser/Thr kinase [Lawsonibacter sp.]|nr:Stk1 family PASTA domain-containing Ser/Thr kinase [Lawsonibacter sp.]